MQIRRNKFAWQIPRNIVSWPIRNNYVLVGIRTIVCVQQPPYHFLQTLHPLCMLKIVFRDSSLYPKQLSLFCLLRLISASADRNGYTSNFCSMIELLHELKKSFFLTWKHSGIWLCLSREKWKLKVCWTSMHTKKLKVFVRTLCAFSILVYFLCSNARIRQDISTAWFCSGKLLRRSDECVLHPVLTRFLIFLHLWTAAS